MSLQEFIELVSTRKDLFNSEIVFNRTKDETDLLKEFCAACVRKKRYIQAWAEILYCLHETFYREDVTDYISQEVIKFLIDNNIELITLGHMNLKDEWLIKVYEKDNRCIEALQTVELRKKLK